MNTKSTNTKALNTKSANAKPGKAKPANAKSANAKPSKAQGKNTKAKAPTPMVSKKAAAKITGFYYFTDREITCRDLLAATGEYDPKSDIWTELNLMEVVLANDSLIFQDAAECFFDPADLKWFDDRQIKAKYDISFDTRDTEEVKKVMKNIMTGLGGMICSDTEDFEPSYTLETLQKMNIR